MADVVVTVPKGAWTYWLTEGDLPGEPETGLYSYYHVSQLPKIDPGERVYIVAHRKLRGYAPLVSLGDGALVRKGGASQ